MVICQSVNQSINQSVNQSINQSINPSINQAVNQSINHSIIHSRKQRKSLLWLKIGNVIQSFRRMKTFAFMIVVRVIELLKSIIQRCGKVCCLMFSHLNLATKKCLIKQKKVSNLHSFHTFPQNHDSKASLNNFFLMHFLGDQLLQNLMKDSIFSWKDCARFW